MKEGDVFRVKFPFVRDTFESWDEDGPAKVATWRPGVRFEPTGPYGEGSEAIADDEGQMVLTVVSIHKPAKYPERVFYTRQFIDPAGHQFGRANLRMTTRSTFLRRASRYHYEYRVGEMADA